MGPDEDSIETYSITYLWGRILDYLLFTPYSSSIIKVLEKGNFITIHKRQILTGFQLEFQNMNDQEFRLDLLLSSFNR